MKQINKDEIDEIAKSFKDTLKNHLKELVDSREFHIKNSNKESIERYDKWIDDTLDRINSMNRIIDENEST